MRFTGAILVDICAEIRNAPRNQWRNHAITSEFGGRVPESETWSVNYPASVVKMTLTISERTNERLLFFLLTRVME